MTFSKPRRHLCGWLAIAIGAIIIILIGFYHPSSTPLDLAFEYAGAYMLAIGLLTVGFLVVADS